MPVLVVLLIVLAAILLMVTALVVMRRVDGARLAAILDDLKQRLQAG
jgi:hypothetical protein